MKNTIINNEIDLTPSQIVEELDRYIIGQEEAKKAVAIALRNRSRRQKVKDALREEISPKNIIMIGATGVGKTEIARRLAKLSGAPFIKVEATKFTEVGYVGRDVESIIRDLVVKAINEEKRRSEEQVQEEAEKMVEENILDVLLPESREQVNSSSISLSNGLNETAMSEEGMNGTREKMREKLRKGELEDKYIEIKVQQPMMKNAFIEFGPDQGLDKMNDMMQSLMGKISRQKDLKKFKIKDARKIFLSESVEKLIDIDKVTEKAIRDTETMGIVFLDEVDKIASREGAKGADISREGVQRDILPLVEGCSVNTKYGVVKTDHILFIASGAFHTANPNDLIPELQGRFPIRVELNTLGAKELRKILTEPKNALVKQYQALLETEDVTLNFHEEAFDEIAHIASEVNDSTHNIGARRLSTVMEKLLENVLYNAPNVDKKIEIDRNYVKERLDEIKKDRDLSKYIL